ncbi:MAG: DUF2141 domain-containing protein [Bacteroidota bacterium]
MKKRLFTMLLLASIFSTAMAQEKGDLTVAVEDITAKGKGKVVFMLFDQKDGFPKEVGKAKYKGEIDTFDATAAYTFEGIPHGEYAVAVFQDKNKNNEIDSNFIGFPKEPVGASNMNKMGKPSYKKSVIQFSVSEKTITLNFIND